MMVDSVPIATDAGTQPEAMGSGVDTGIMIELTADRPVPQGGFDDVVKVG